VNPITAVSGVVVFLGLASFGVLAWALRSVSLLDRAVGAGDVVVIGVFALFGCFCVSIGWLLLRHRPEGEAAPVDATSRPRSRRVTLSQGCATAGVVLLMLSVLLPEGAHPVVLLFIGLALLSVSHVLTPCEERLEKLRRARASLRQL
jgi:hypothetical protein